MSENDKPFTFTDKRTSTKGEEPDMNEQPTDGAPEETPAPDAAGANSTETISPPRPEPSTRVLPPRPKPSKRK